MLGEQLALAEGRATAHNLNVSVDAASPVDGISAQEEAALREWIDRILAADDATLAAEARRLCGDTDVG